MPKSQDVADYIAENPAFIKDVAKEAFKACRKGKIPVALAAAGVAVVGGVVIEQVVEDAADPDLIDAIADWI